MPLPLQEATVFNHEDIREGRTMRVVGGRRARVIRVGHVVTVRVVQERARVEAGERRAGDINIRCVREVRHAGKSQVGVKERVQ